MSSILTTPADARPSNSWSPDITYQMPLSAGTLQSSPTYIIIHNIDNITHSDHTSWRPAFEFLILWNHIPNAPVCWHTAVVTYVYNITQYRQCRQFWPHQLTPGLQTPDPPISHPKCPCLLAHCSRRLSLQGWKLAVVRSLEATKFASKQMVLHLKSPVGELSWKSGSDSELLRKEGAFECIYKIEMEYESQWITMIRCDPFKEYLNNFNKFA